MMETDEEGVEVRSTFDGVERSRGMRNRILSLVTVFLFAWGAHAELLYSSSQDALKSFEETDWIQIEVTGGRKLSVSGQVLCSGTGKQVMNAMACAVRFVGDDGRTCSSGMLPSSERWGEYFYVNGTIEESVFTRGVLIPDKAKKAAIKLFKVEGKHVCRVRNFKLEENKVTFHRSVIFRFLSAGPIGLVSLRFLAFIGVALLLYYLMPFSARPWGLLFFSILFYAVFSLKALVFLLSSLVSIYLAGLAMQKGRLRGGVLFSVLTFNLGLLVTVKYGSSLFDGWSIIVPLGISFYTLQALSYCIDVYRGDCQAERNPFRLMLFLSFFPIIMQGPISRYAQLGSQLSIPQRFSEDNLREGLQLMLWGYFKKMVIADRAAIAVNSVFAPGSDFAGVSVLVAAILYSVQIYADFSGCVDICCGVAQTFGIKLVNNFNHPYFSQSVAEFWRRWHISLSSWLKDYLYIPLGGNRRGAFRKYLNVLIVFAVSGLWHGTGMTFFVWGILHGVYQIIGAASRSIRMVVCRVLAIDEDCFASRMWRTVWTFLAVTFAWIFFRSASLQDAGRIIRQACVFNPWTVTQGALLKLGLDCTEWIVLLLAIAVLWTVSLIQERLRIRSVLQRQPIWFRWSIAILGVIVTVTLGVYGPGYSASQFIYMQF